MVPHHTLSSPQPHTLTPSLVSRENDPASLEGWLLFENFGLVEEGGRTETTEPVRSELHPPAAVPPHEREPQHDDHTHLYSLSNIMSRVCDIPLDCCDTPLSSTPTADPLGRGDTPLPSTPPADAGFELRDDSLAEEGMPLTPSRHVAELQSAGRGLVGPAGEPGMDEIDKDWEQWLMFQEAMENW